MMIPPPNPESQKLRYVLAIASHINPPRRDSSERKDSPVAGELHPLPLLLMETF